MKVDTASRGRSSGRVEGGQWPHDNHLSPDGERLYNASIGTIIAPAEARPGLGRPPYLLTVASTRDQRVLRTFAFERGIRPIVVTHDEARMFAQLSEYHGIVEADLRTGEIVRRVDLPIDPGVTSDDYDFEAPHHGLAITPDERVLCAAGRASDYVALVAAEGLQPLAIIEVDDAPGWATTGPGRSVLLRPEHARRHAVGHLLRRAARGGAGADGRRPEADRGGAPARARRRGRVADPRLPPRRRADDARAR